MVPDEPPHTSEPEAPPVMRAHCQLLEAASKRGTSRY